MSTLRGTGVAIIGARDGSLWTNLLARNLTGWDYPGAIWPVSRTRPEVAGRRTYPSLEELPDIPDAVVIATGAEESVRLARQCIAMGITHVVTIADGFAERGTPEGRALQLELAALPQGTSSRLYGPNGVGFADFRSGLCPVAAPIPAALKIGPVGLISQSGSLLSSITGGLLEDGIGVDWCVSLGNGAAFDFADALAYLIDRDTTRVICGYADAFGRADRARIEALFVRARDVGKPIVLIKAGGSERSARIAMSHTASVAGADRVISDIMERHGVIRAYDTEELVRTVSLLVYFQSMPPQPGRMGGVAVLEGSGGAAAVVADRLQREGVSLATFSEATIAVLRETAPPGAFVENPVDLTAAPKSPEAIANAYRTVYRDPAVSAVIVPWALTFPGADEGRELHHETIDRYASLTRDTGTPTILSSANLHDWTGWMRDFRAAHPEILCVRGLAATAAALRHILPAGADGRGAASAGAGLIDEAAGRAILATLGVPLVGGVLCRPPFTTMRRDIETLRPPFAVKVIADGVAHRARIGAVVLGCRDFADVECARDTILGNVARAGVATERVRGLLVEEMAFGPELFVGCNRDPWYGAYLVLARGGVNVEESGKSRILPIAATLAEIGAAICELGIVGVASTAVIDAAARLVERVAAAFGDGSLSGYATVELNPVILDAGGPKIADVLLVGVA